MDGTALSKRKVTVSTCGIVPLPPFFFLKVFFFL
jgi:hypothetical protein